MKFGKANRRLTRKNLTEKVRKVNVPDDYPWIVLGAMVQDLASASSISTDDVALVTQIIRDRDASALALLTDQWGLQCILPHFGDLSTHMVRGRRLLAGLLKKYLFPSDADARRAKALKKFLEAEDVCKAFNHGGHRSITANGEWVASVLTSARSFICDVLGPRPLFDKLIPWARFGPGATLGGRMSTSEYFKYAKWPYTVTRSCMKYARFIIESDQRWMGALLESYRIRKKIPMHHPIDMGRFWPDVFELVDGNRIGFVPKDSSVDRTIAIEPLMNLRLQLGVDGFIRRKLKRYDIDLDSQVKNQVMASLGSELRTNHRYSTIDLSSASDSISLKLCELLLPTDWYSFLLALRSPEGYIQGHGRVQYEKISSMGNGYTFVLESLIFASLIFGVLKQEKGKVDFVKDLAVYGDDLIVNEIYYDKVILALQNAGFTVNLEKSFKYGLVKESCGTDWYNGHLVRPVALSAKPESVMDLFVDFNRLLRIQNLYFGITEKESITCQTILKWIPVNFRHYRGPVSDEDFSTYLHTPDYKTFGSYRYGRWCYHRLVIRPVSVRVEGWRHFNFRKLMDPLSETPRTLSPFEVRVSGSRFAVTKLKDNVTVGQSHKPASSTWQAEYVDVTGGNAFRLQCSKNIALRNLHRIYS